MLGWTVLAFTLVVGLVVLATGVEQGVHGWAAALSGGLAVAPEVAVLLAPLCCAVGSAMTLARRMASGEDVGLAACGIRPWRSGRSVVAVGLAIGLLSLVVADQVVPSVHRGVPTPTWVWLDGGPVRASDGLRVQIAAGRIQSVAPGPPVSDAALMRAQWNHVPRLAPASALRESSAPPMVVERWARRARVLACGLLAWIGWLPVARRGTTQVGWAISAGATVTGVDLFLRQLANQGRMSPLIGALGALILLVGLAAVLRGRS